MRAYQFEAEIRTSASKNIRNALRSKGYKLIGSGADATVWAKNENEVVKIIMPDNGLGSGNAAETFFKFYQFCESHSDLQNLPKFMMIDKEGQGIFTEDGKDYVMIIMEKLAPIPNGSFQEAMVWILSELATRKMNWEQAEEIINDPNTWIGYEGGLDPEDIIMHFQSLKLKEVAEYQVLFSLMTLLFHTGRINKQDWDLHTENAMMRGNTIVITDPWINLET